MRDKRNTTGVIGVCRQEYRERSGRWFVRYIAEWPKSDGTRASASFSGNLYGEEDAFELAVYCWRKGLRELGLPRAYFWVGISALSAFTQNRRSADSRRTAQFLRPKLSEKPSRARDSCDRGTEELLHPRDLLSLRGRVRGRNGGSMKMLALSDTNHNRFVIRAAQFI